MNQDSQAEQGLRINPRPNAEVGTFIYWRLEVREFFLLCDAGTDDKERLAAAFFGLFHLAGKTEPTSAMEDLFVASDFIACATRYERALSELG